MSVGPQIVNHPVEYDAGVLQARSVAPGAVRGAEVVRIVTFYQCSGRNAAGQNDA
jgi:hypothetical protein